EQDVYTNTGPARAFRAPGFPQGCWALEQTMDALAAKLGMDPLELRLKNIPLVSQTEGNQPYSSTGLADCLRKGAEEFGWKQARARANTDGRLVRGVGVAAALWGYAGGPPATAILKLFPDGSAHLNMGAADLGTGTKTVMSMIVAEELGIPVEKVSLEYADTGTTQYTDPSGGSKTVVSDGPAVRNAAADVKTRLLQMASAQLNVPVSELSLRDGAVVGAAKPLPLGELAELAAQRVVIGVGTREPNPRGVVTRPFSANFAEVEVNTATGEVKVLRLLGAHDSGRPMNLLTYRNQVFGGMVMAMGYSMTERRILDPRDGKMVNARWQDYKLPTALDAPREQTCVPIDAHDESNNLGAKGLGEPATIASAAAIANAFYNATGARITAMPINVPQVMELLEQRRKRS
ncbi:MAG TPA: molybdopterin cofactor-binding domain-containing protein, partial [Bryobacteraceae bacterium]